MPSTYYSNCTILAPGCHLYSTTTLTTVPPGKYSDGFTCWTVGSGGTISGSTPCSTVTPTTTVPPGCFVAGTMINMLDGTMKPVEELVVNDSLLSIESLANFYKDELFDLIETRVLSINSYTVDKLININNGLLISSETHIHITKRNNRWEIVKAFDIVVGDILIDRYGNEIAIFSVEVEEKEQIVYNVDVDNQDVYFANNILTHNKPNYICCSDGSAGGTCSWINISGAPSSTCIGLGLIDCSTC